MNIRNTDIINGLNSYLSKFEKDKIRVGKDYIFTQRPNGIYYKCSIAGSSYLIAFKDDSKNRPGKSFIHLIDKSKEKPSLVQLTIDESNFKIKGKKFFFIQNRGLTIGRKVVGLEEEFKKKMIENGFNNDFIIASQKCISTDYGDLLEQIFKWLKIRVKTKAQLENKYRKIEDPVFEMEPEMEEFNDIISKTEGGDKVVISIKSERNPKLREDAIKLHGLTCKVCEFNFKDIYGEWGENFIEVHHLIPLKSQGHRETNPQTDLTVLCSNCHRMIHRKKDVTLTIDELKQKIKK